MKLDYSDFSFGIAWGCEKVSPGCAHCYAHEDVTLKYGMEGLWGSAETTARRVHSLAHWKKPLKWNEDSALWIPAKHEGKAHPIVFCSPMCDVFENHPTIDGERKKLWPLIEKTPNLDWHIITKRFDNVEKNLPWGKNDKPWPNVWVSMSIENDVWAKKRLPTLASLNVAVRGAHVEPLLGPVPSLSASDAAEMGDGNKKDL